MEGQKEEQQQQDGEEVEQEDEEVEQRPSGGGWLSGAWSLGQSLYNAAANTVSR